MVPEQRAASSSLNLGHPIWPVLALMDPEDGLYNIARVAENKPDSNLHDVSKIFS